MIRMMSPRWILPFATLFLFSGCETRVGLEGASGGADPVGLPGAVQNALVGEWSLILINQDASGALVSSSETRWRFDANGAVTRSSIATNFPTGLQEIVRTTGTWTATPTTVTINLLNPPAGTLVLPWRLEQNGSEQVLVLGTLRFVRRG